MARIHPPHTPCNWSQVKLHMPMISYPLNHPPAVRQRCEIPLRSLCSIRNQRVERKPVPQKPSLEESRYYPSLKHQTISSSFTSSWQTCTFQDTKCTEVASSSAKRKMKLLLICLVCLKLLWTVCSGRVWLMYNSNRCREDSTEWISLPQILKQLQVSPPKHYSQLALCCIPNFHPSEDII